MSAPPQLWIIAGPNGSGKSTLTRNYFQARGIPIPLVNPDDILRENPGSSHLHAGRQAIALQDNYLEQGCSFIVETTLAGNHGLRVMRAAKLRGYKVNLVYICLENPEVSLFRILSRVDGGGHDVPEEDVRRRYSGSLANLYDALLLADRSFVLDNSMERPRLLISRADGKTRLIARQGIPGWFLATATRLGLFPGTG